MPIPPRISSRTVQTISAGAALMILIGGAFEVGRHSVDAADTDVEKPAIEAPSAPAASSSKPQATLEQTQVIMRNVATVPFSELYDVLKSTSRDQLVAWARDLEQMPRGPRQRSAVTAYYKSLVQVDHRTAFEIILHAKNLNTRDLAVDAVLKAAPESIWAEVAEMTVQLPYQGRGGFREDIISNWSRVDPVAASQFIENHPLDPDVLARERGEDNRVSSLLQNWAAIDPSAARTWLEADPSRQTKGAFRALVATWAVTDRSAAINYAVANAAHPNLDETINDFAYGFVRRSFDEATALILRLPAEQAKTALEHVARTTRGGLWMDGEDYKEPPNIDLFARWMVNLPPELWSESIGYVAREWLKEDVTAGQNWLNQLEPKLRDAAIISFCHAAESESAVQVLTLGSTLSDERLQAKLFVEFVRKLGTGSEAAIDAINDLPVADEQREYLRNLVSEDANAR